MTETQSELHNRIVGPIIDSIVRPVLMLGGNSSSVMLLAESVMMGVILFCFDQDCDDEILKILFDHLKMRISEMRLSGSPPAGSA